MFPGNVNISINLCCYKKIAFCDKTASAAGIKTSSSVCFPNLSQNMIPSSMYGGVN